MSLEGIMIPIADAIGMTAVSLARQTLAQCAQNLDEELRVRLYPMTEAVGYAVSRICEEGGHTKARAAKGLLTIVVTEDAMLSASIDIKGELEHGIFEDNEHSNSEGYLPALWTAIYDYIDSEDSEERFKATTAATLSITKEAAVKLAEMVQCDEDGYDMPLLITLVARDKEAEGGPRVGGISFVIPFPIMIATQFERMAALQAAAMFTQEQEPTHRLH